MTDDLFHHTTAWLIDLDDTVYPRSSGVFIAIENNIKRFLMERYGFDDGGAGRERQRFVATYGTTLRGLMVEKAIDPHDFVDFVHDVDLSGLSRDPTFAATLAALPGRKVIFTNGTAAHAERVLDRLGIRDCFCGVYDIEAAGWVPKPAPETYVQVIDRFAIDPARAVMADDATRNLAPAKTFGMRTVLVAETAPAEVPPSIDRVIASLPAFLANVAGLAAAPA